jgi:hypothetical protein
LFLTVLLSAQVGLCINHKKTHGVNNMSPLQTSHSQALRVPTPVRHNDRRNVIILCRLLLKTVSIFVDVLTLEGGSIMLLRNIGVLLPLARRRMPGEGDSSAVPVGKPQNLHLLLLLTNTSQFQACLSKTVADTVC